MTKNTVDEVMRQRIAERVPTLGVVSVGVALVWMVLVALTGRVPLALAVGLLVFQIGVFSIATLLARAGRHARWTVVIAVTACVLTVHSWTVFFAVIGGSTILLVFVIFAMLIYAPLIVPWGWRAEAVFCACAIAAWPVAIPYFHTRLLPSERFVVFTAGAIIAVGAAKWFTDVFRSEIRRQMSEETMRGALAASRDAYRDLAENAHDLIWAADLEGRLTYVNEAFIRAFGPAESLIGSRIDNLRTDHPDNPDFPSLVTAHAAGERVLALVAQSRTLSGPRWFEALVTAIQETDGRIVGMRGIGRDITERREAEEALQASLEELRRSEERLRSLAQRQTVVREQERKRLSFDLHDDVCQELVGVGMLIESVRQRLPAAPADVVADLARGAEYLNRLVEHLRVLAGELRPMMLHQLGLEQSLRALGTSVSCPETRVTVEFPRPIPWLDEDAELAIYRIAQEAVLNAVRHAGATSVGITATSSDGRVRLRVQDDGHGFDVRSCGGGIGLLSMEERALALGGRLDVRSQPGGGTIVELDFPWAAAAPPSEI